MSSCQPSPASATAAICSPPTPGSKPSSKTSSPPLKSAASPQVVLVGHSFAGSVITGVADRIPARIGRLIYLDAAVPQSGQSAFSLLPPDIAASRRRDAAASSGGLTLPVPPAAAFGVTDPADAAWLTRQLRPHPVKSYEDTLQLRHPVGNGRPKTYIACTSPGYPLLASTRQWVRSQPGWDYQELATGHDAMITAPQLLAALLLAE